MKTLKVLQSTIHQRTTSCCWRIIISIIYDRIVIVLISPIIKLLYLLGAVMALRTDSLLHEHHLRRIDTAIEARQAIVSIHITVV